MHHERLGTTLAHPGAAVRRLPAGLDQAWHSITEGLWYARSAEIIHSPVMETLVWLRVPGDVIFAAGGVFLALFAWRGGARERLPESLGVPAG